MVGLNRAILEGDLDRDTLLELESDLKRLAHGTWHSELMAVTKEGAGIRRHFTATRQRKGF